MVVKVVFFLACFLLASCTDAVISGAQMVYNRRSIESNMKDSFLSLKANQVLDHYQTRFKDCHLTIETLHEHILIAGSVDHDWQRHEIMAILGKALPDQVIHNMIIVGKKVSALKRLSDGWLTLKIKSKLLVSNEVDVREVKVVTVNGTVYLMGILPPSEAQAAISLARQTDGVEAVVKIISYLRISKS